MKRNIFLVIFIMYSLSGFGYLKSLDKKEIKEYCWGINDNSKNHRTVPAGVSESVLILYNETARSFQNATDQKIKCRSLERTLFYINDEAGVAELTEFEIWFQKLTWGVRLIKKNGSIQEFDSLSVKTVKSAHGEKVVIAIPNLQVGDIIDVYTFDKSEEIATVDINANFGAKYPVLYLKFELDVKPIFLINFVSLNNTPEMSKTVHDEGRWNIYEMELKNLNGIYSERYHISNQSMPSVRYRIMDTPVDPYSASAHFTGPWDKLGAPLTKARLEGYVKGSLIHTISKNGKIASDIKKAFPNETDKVILAKEVYNHIRCEYMLSNREFLHTIQPALEKLEISHDVIVFSNRTMYGIKQLISPLDVEIAIRINEGPKPFYLFYYGIEKNRTFSSFIQPGEIPPSAQGQEFYSVKVFPGNYRDQPFVEEKFPILSPENNSLLFQSKLNIDVEEGSVTFFKNISANGYPRFQYCNELFNYDTLKLENYVSIPSYGQSYQKDLEKLKVKCTKSCLDLMDYRYRFLNKIESDNLDVELKKDQLKNFSIASTGRNYKSPFLTFNIEGKTPNFIQSQGDNYLFNVGSFIVDNEDLTDKERERNYDAYFPAPFKVSNKIELVIPEGYQVLGIEKLSSSKVNTAGSFTMHAKVEGNSLILTTDFTCALLTLPKNEWSYFVELSDAVKSARQSKILLVAK